MAAAASPGYNIKMEILISCPLDPDRTLIRELCSDLPIRSQAGMVALIRSMIPQLPIQLVFTETHGFVIFILRSDWIHVRAIGQRYWETVYG